MNHIVSQRFIKCIERLKEDKVIPSARQFALSLEFPPQNLHEICNQKRDVTIDLLQKAIEHYHISAQYIFEGKGTMFVKEDKDMGFRLLTIVTDPSNNEKIVHVPIPAQAGYISEMADPTFFNELPTFSLPDYRYTAGTHRSFDVDGDSMEPVLEDGDKLICSFIEPNNWVNSLKDDSVYVIVTRGDIVVKRIANKIKSEGIIELHSDNDCYKPYSVDINDVKEIWYVRTKLSPFSHKPQEAHQRTDSNTDLDHLKKIIQDQSVMINRLNSTIQQLVNASSAVY